MRYIVRLLHLRLLWFVWFVGVVRFKFMEQFYMLKLVHLPELRYQMAVLRVQLSHHRMFHWLKV